MLDVKHHFEVSESIEDIFDDEEAFDLVEENFKVFVDVVDVRISFIGILVSPNKEQEMTSPNVYLRRTGPICHVRLQVDKTSINLISQQHALRPA